MNYPLMSNNINSDDIQKLIGFLQSSNRFTNGPKVVEFENEWAKWLGCKYCVFVNSGSSANYISMAVIRQLFGPGEVIVPPIAWESDISSVFAAGLTPVFVDLKLNNLAMNEDEILNHITDKTRCVFITHVLGFNALSEKLINELSERNIPIVEDVCESHGTMCGKRKAGTIGIASNFSFYYAHHMSTIEGGMICTNDERFYELSRLFRSHGMLRECNDTKYIEKTCEKFPDLYPEFIFTVPGYNMRSTELNAVIGLSQMHRLEDNISRRQENFKLFLENIDSELYYTDFDLSGQSNYAFVVILRKKYNYKFSKLCQLLDDEGIEYRRGTAGGGNLARQPFVRRLMPDFDPATLKNADYIHFNGLYTGNYPDLTRETILQFCSILNRISRL